MFGRVHQGMLFTPVISAEEESCEFSETNTFYLYLFCKINLSTYNF